MAKAKYKYNEARKEWYTLVYDGTVTESGKKRRRRVTSKKSSADLEKKVLAFKQSLKEGNALISNITFGEYAQRWYESAKASKEINTRKMYQSVLKASFNEINDVPLANITHSHFQRCINAKLEHSRMCILIKQTFGQIVRSAVREHLMPRNAIEDVLMDVSLPKYKKPLKRPLSDAEKEAIKNAELDQRKRCFVSILFYCGLRKGEVLALTAADFDFKLKTLSVSKAWVDGIIKPYPKSDNGIRVVPLPDASIDYIRPFVEAEPGYIFHGKNGPIMTANAYRRMWESIIYNLNKVAPDPIDNLTAHVFRHNYCTELCYQIPTISTKMIARLLGDSEKMVIDVYSHLIEEKENVTDAVNQIFA